MCIIETTIFSYLYGHLIHYSVPSPNPTCSTPIHNKYTSFTHTCGSCHPRSKEFITVHGICGDIQSHHYLDLREVKSIPPPAEKTGSIIPHVVETIDSLIDPVVGVLNGDEPRFENERKIELENMRSESGAELTKITRKYLLDQHGSSPHFFTPVPACYLTPENQCPVCFGFLLPPRPSWPSSVLSASAFPPSGAETCESSTAIYLPCGKHAYGYTCAREMLPHNSQCGICKQKFDIEWFPTMQDDYGEGTLRLVKRLALWDIQPRRKYTWWGTVKRGACRIVALVALPVVLVWKGIVELDRWGRRRVGWGWIETYGYVVLFGIVEIVVRIWGLWMYVAVSLYLLKEWAVQSYSRRQG